MLFALTNTKSSALISDGESYDQSGIPIEVQPTDPNLSKIVLVAGSRSHGPGEHEFLAGCAIMRKLLQQTAGVFPVIARDGWPRSPETFEKSKAVVFYMDGGSGHPILQKDHKQVVQKLLDSGVGFVNLHYAVEYPKSQSDHVLNWLGGYYETGFSTNPHWQADFQNLPEHQITRGVAPFRLHDEWYFNIRFAPESGHVTPILKAIPPDNKRATPDAQKYPGRSEIVAWAFERSNGRSFAFTGGHFHRNWGDQQFRRLVTNAILWTAHIEVPKDGAAVDLDPTELKRNLDRK
jgi:type 1 glutamine amidotransferase